MRHAIFLLAICVSCCAHAFDYNQRMIEFEGGVVSQLNNCGLNYSSSGIFNRGYGNLTANLSYPKDNIIDFRKMAKGIVAILDNGKLYFSPNGKLIGGPESILIDTIKSDSYVTGIRATGISVGLAREDEKIISLSVSGTHALVLLTKSLHIYKIDLPTGALQSKKKLEFSRTSLSDSTFPVFMESISGPDGDIIMQFRNGEVRRARLTQLIETGKLITLKATHPHIKQIVDYNGGLLTLLEDSKIYQIKNGGDPLRGTLFYNGAIKISSLLPFRENNSNRTGLFVNYLNGRTVFFPDGSSIDDEGNSIEVASPINVTTFAADMRRRFVDYEKYYWGGYVTDIEVSVRLLNKGQSTVYDGTWFVGMDGINRIFVQAASFAGDPAEITVYDKGWDGIEYKWRDRGTQRGTILHTHTQSKAGQTEIKLAAKNSCAILIGVSQAGETPNPIDLKIKEPKSFYSMTQSTGLAPVSGKKFILNALAAAEQLLVGDEGWNIWTFYKDAGSLSALLGYLQHAHNFDLSRTFFHYGKKEIDRLPGYQRGRDEIYAKDTTLIRHKGSSQCIHPSGGSPFPAVGTPLVLHPLCDPSEERLLFTFLPNGVLQHESSGLCVLPEGGAAQPGKRLILSDDCYRVSSKMNDLSFNFASGYFKHSSTGLCIHPTDISEIPQVGSELVLSSGCDAERLKFTRFSSLPSESDGDSNGLQKPDPNVGALRHVGGLCAHPESGEAIPSNGTSAVLRSGCGDYTIKLRFLPNGSIQHAASGKCLHPEGGSANPDNWTRLVFWEGCDEPRLNFEFLADGNLRHKASGKCVHPEWGSSTPEEGTYLVFWDICGEDRLKFDHLSAQD